MKKYKIFPLGEAGERERLIVGSRFVTRDLQFSASILIVLECSLFLPSKSNVLGWLAESIGEYEQKDSDSREARRVLLLPGFLGFLTPSSASTDVVHVPI